MALLILIIGRTISGAPIKLVPDVHTYATSFLGHFQAETPSVASSSYLTNFSGGGDDDSDEAEASSPIVNRTLDDNNNNNPEPALGSANQANASGEQPSNLSSVVSSNVRKSHIIRLPNGQSFQVCDESIDLKCNDENAVCKLGTCVCKSAFFLHRQSGLCNSISDLLKNCENDHQCQAFDVDLVCDTKSHERPFCDCAHGLYFDQETHTCLPCHRNTLIISAASGGGEQAALAVDMDVDALPQVYPNTSDSDPGAGSGAKSSLRPCWPVDLMRVNSRRRQQLSYAGLTPYPTLLSVLPSRGSSSSSFSASGSPAAPTATTTSTATSASSDPFRIKTPLEVFMGAIMLFTLFTVAWFFLQRMIHDCRAILRSLRNPDHSFATGSTCGEQSAFAGPLGGLVRARSANHLYFDPAGQAAVARLFSPDAYNQHHHHSFAGNQYQRELAGVMVQHLAANLSPSSTSHALVSNASSRALNPMLNLSSSAAAQNEHDAALYPLTASAQQSRNAAAAAAAQLLLSPTHPAIAILRAAAAAHQPEADYVPGSLFRSLFTRDPPPKYEEAIAQTNAVSYPPPPPFVEQSVAILRAPDLQANEETIDSSSADVSGLLNVYTPTNNDLAQSDDLLEIVFTNNAADTTSRPQSPTSRSNSPAPASSDLQQPEPASGEPGQKRTKRRFSKRRQTRSRSQQQSQDSDDTLTESHNN